MKEKMIVAFLQNLWVKDPERVMNMLNGKSEAYRRRLLKKLLFYRGLTGKRLNSAFGDLCDSIVWEEASREIAGNASSICAPDIEHIQNVLNELRPNIVIAFGKISIDAVSKCWNGELLSLPHPAARKADIMENLRQGAKRVREFCESSI